MRYLALIAIALLALFSTRRMLWVAAAWRRRRPAPDAKPLSRVLIAVAFRNERAALPRLLECLSALDYDPDLLQVCLVDDASDDGGGELAEEWTRGSPNRALVRLDERSGKAEALNRALAATTPPPDLVAVYDADQAPRPDALRRLVAPFSDPAVDAACGYRRPVFDSLNPVSAYGCLEAWTHQLVTLAAKEALGLNPPTMGGNCVYRRTALARVGDFRAGARSEDIDVSLAIAATGGVTRFVSEAVSDDSTTGSLGRHIEQRLRWSRGLRAAGERADGVEARFVAIGYGDRIALLLAVISVAAGAAGPLWLLVYLIPALAAVLTALVQARPGAKLASFVVLSSPLMFALDLLVSLAALFPERRA